MMIIFRETGRNLGNIAEFIWIIFLLIKKCEIKFIDRNEKDHD